jgi:hypothetical protein
MELDELKEKWAEHDKKLDQSIRLNRQLMRETYTGELRPPVAAGGDFGLGSIACWW